MCDVLQRRTSVTDSSSGKDVPWHSLPLHLLGNNLVMCAAGLAGARSNSLVALAKPVADHV
jgi:hypothetical protein